MSITQTFRSNVQMLRHFAFVVLTVFATTASAIEVCSAEPAWKGLTADQRARVIDQSIQLLRSHVELSNLAEPYHSYYDLVATLIDLREMEKARLILSAFQGREAGEGDKQFWSFMFGLHELFGDYAAADGALRKTEQFLATDERSQLYGQMWTLGASEPYIAVSKRFDQHLKYYKSFETKVDRYDFASLYRMHLIWMPLLRAHYLAAGGDFAGAIKVFEAISVSDYQASTADMKETAWPFTDAVKWAHLYGRFAERDDLIALALKFLGEHGAAGIGQDTVRLRSFASVGDAFVFSGQDDLAAATYQKYLHLAAQDPDRTEDSDGFNDGCTIRVSMQDNLLDPKDAGRHALAILAKIDALAGSTSWRCAQYPDAKEDWSSASYFRLLPHLRMIDPGQIVARKAEFAPHDRYNQFIPILQELSVGKTDTLAKRCAANKESRIPTCSDGVLMVLSALRGKYVPHLRRVLTAG